MTASCKFLFSLALVICLTSACRSKKPVEQTGDEEPRPLSAGAVEGDEPLEARCFDGDQAACDELGH